MKSEQKIYQFKIILKGVTPEIWRRILIYSDNTLADLHYVIQIIMGWTDYHLNEFIIHKQYYSIPNIIGGTSGSSYVGKNVKLCDLKLRTNKKFSYLYDFTAGWKFDIILEKTLPIDQKATYPTCISGAGASPEEECGGADWFLKRKDHWEYEIYEVLDELVAAFADEKNASKRICDVIDIEKVEQAQYWMNVNKYKRKNVNKYLKYYANNDERWREAFDEII